MEISNVEQLIEAFPDLVNQIQDSAANKAKTEAEAETKKAERANIIKLIEIQFGAEAAEQFKTIVESGMTAEQFQAAKNLNPPKKNDDAADDDAADEAAAKDAALAAIQNAGADNPGPDSPAVEKDYLTVCREYMAQHGVDMLAAQRAIDRQNPGLRKSFIRRANQAA